MFVKNIRLEDFESSMKYFYIERIEGTSYESKPHNHDCFQIVYCKQGRLTHHLNDVSAKMLRGDISIIPPNTEHHISDNEKNSIYYNIAFEKRLLEDFSGVKLAHNLFASLLKTDNLLAKMAPKYDDIYLLESVIGKIRVEFEGQKTSNSDNVTVRIADEKKEMIIVCLICVLSVIARIYMQFEDNLLTEADRKNKRINHCIFYIDTHYDEPIPLEKIVRMSAMSKSTFCSLFKEATGMTFNDYLNKKRIERIQTIIRNGGDITTAAYYNGFKELSTFYRNFVKFSGMTPSEFKKQVAPAGNSRA